MSDESVSKIQKRLIVFLSGCVLGFFIGYFINSLGYLTSWGTAGQNVEIARASLKFTIPFGFGAVIIELLFGGMFSFITSQTKDWEKDRKATLARRLSLGYIAVGVLCLLLYGEKAAFIYSLPWSFVAQFAEKCTLGPFYSHAFKILNIVFGFVMNGMMIRLLAFLI